MSDHELPPFPEDSGADFADSRLDPPANGTQRTESTYRGGLGSRREARERAVGLLYEAEAKGLSPAGVVDALPIAPETFTAELVVGVSEHGDELDELISRHARGWKLERMPSIDRAVLRLATFELVFRPEIPTGAVISEAVELVKQYSTEESGRFVNGMLSAIAEVVRGEPGH